MSRLAIYDEQGSVLGDAITDHNAIAAQLHPLGVRFKRWAVNRPLSSDAQQDEVLAAYGDQVQRLTDEYGYKSIDVVSLRPDNPKRDELRARFLAEHTHGDFLKCVSLWKGEDFSTCMWQARCTLFYASRAFSSAFPRTSATGSTWGARLTSNVSACLSFPMAGLHSSLKATLHGYFPILTSL